MARAGGWLVGARRVRALITLLLAVFMLPQQVLAVDNRDDYEDGYVGRDWSWSNDWNTVYVTETYFDDYGTDEGWCDSGGLLIKASKDGGNNSSERYEE